MGFKIDPATGKFIATDNTMFGGTGYSKGSTLTPEQYNSILPTDTAMQANALKAQELGLAKSLGGLQTGIGAVQALGGLYGLYQGKKALDLEKEKFGFQKQATAADFASKAKSYNEELNRSGDVGLAIAGSSMTPEQKAAAVAARKQYEVNPTALGGKV